MAAGVAAGAVAAARLGLPLPLALASAGVAGVAALLPDLDHPQSFAARRVAGGQLVAMALRHRGPTHSVAALAAFAAALPWLARLAAVPLPLWAWAAAVAGYASHLLADLLTREGLRLFWPLSGVRVSAGPLACATGSAAESLFWRPAFALAAGAVLLKGVGIA